MYAYVENNPLRWIDPFGLLGIDFGPDVSVLYPEPYVVPDGIFEGMEFKEQPFNEFEVFPDMPGEIRFFPIDSFDEPVPIIEYKIPFSEIPPEPDKSEEC